MNTVPDSSPFGIERRVLREISGLAQSYCVTISYLQHLLCCWFLVLLSIVAVDTHVGDGAIESSDRTGSVTEGSPLGGSQATLGGGQGDRA